MKKLIASIVCLAGLAIFAFGQDRTKNWLATTAGQRQLQRAFTTGGLFGVPRYATANIPTCDASQEGAVVYDTTTNQLKSCNGSAFAAAPAQSDTNVFTGVNTFGTAADAANTWAAGVTAGSITFEGSGADDFEMTLTPANPGSDVTVTIPATTTTLSGNAIANTFTAANTFQAQMNFGAAGNSARHVGTKTLTESAATSAAQISVGAEAGTAGFFIYTVYATDGSTPQVRSGTVQFNVQSDGGTETCILTTPAEQDNTPTGTLTAAITCSTTPTNAVDLQINAASSLTQTTLEAYYIVDLAGPGTITPQ